MELSLSGQNATIQRSDHGAIRTRYSEKRKCVGVETYTIPWKIRS